MKYIIKLFMLINTFLFVLQAEELTSLEKEYLNKHTIKIAMTKDYYPFTYEENGKINGFSYEYFKLLASKVNLKYEIQLNYWSTNLKNFRDKKIDIIDGISYTKQREPFTNFTDPYFSIPNVIFAQKNSIKNYNGLESLKGMKVGITKGIYYYNTIKDLNLFELVEFENSREKMKALAYGKIDIAFNSLTSGQRFILDGAYTNIEIVDEIDRNIVKKEDLNLGITKDDEILFNIIQKATSRITPDEKLELTKKYFNLSKEKKYIKPIELTKEERDWIKQNPQVSVAQVSLFPPFSYKHNGKLVGYEIDLLELISQKTGLDFNIVDGNWSENINKFKAQKIDIISSISYKKEREEFTSFTQPYYEIPNVIFVRDDFGNYKNIKSLTGKKVGIVKDVFYENELRALGYLNIVEYSSEVDLAKALVYNNIEASIGSLTTMNNIIKGNLYSNLKLVDELLLPNVSKNDLRFGINPNKPILYSIFNKSLSDINENEKNDILDKWINIKSSSKNQYQDTRLFLTEKEKSHLNNKDNTITMCIDPNWMPLEALNENGKHIGMSADYFKTFSELIGVDFKVIKSNSWNESLQLAKTRKCDIISLIMKTPQRSKYLNFTSTYLSIPLVIATKNDITFINDITELNGYKVAIPKGYSFAEHIINKYPKIEIINVENLQEGLEKVSSGDSHAYIGTLTSVGQLIQKEYIGELKISGKLKNNYDLSIGVRNDDELLLNILQKAINSLPQEIHSEILNKWVSIKYDSSVNYTFLLYLALLSISLISFLLYRQFNTNKINVKLEKMSITDGLTNVYNRRFFNEYTPKIINMAKRNNDLISFVLIDIDYFKLYNDTYGHQMGDKALIKVSKAIKDSLKRADDYCFRLGGEEFGVIFKANSKENAIDFANNIRTNIENLHIEHSKNSASSYITVSIGVVCKNSNEIHDIHDIYKHTDDLLYEAKNSGRNKVCY